MARRLASRSTSNGWGMDASSLKSAAMFNTDWAQLVRNKYFIAVLTDAASFGREGWSASV